MQPAPAMLIKSNAKVSVYYTQGQIVKVMALKTEDDNKDFLREVMITRRASQLNIAPMYLYDIHGQAHATLSTLSWDVDLEHHLRFVHKREIKTLLNLLEVTLLKMVDAGIHHRDLRSENIVVKLKDHAWVEGVAVVDYGHSVLCPPESDMFELVKRVSKGEVLCYLVNLIRRLEKNGFVIPDPPFLKEESFWDDCQNLTFDDMERVKEYEKSVLTAQAFLPYRAASNDDEEIETSS